MTDTRNHLRTDTSSPTTAPDEHLHPQHDDDHQNTQQHELTRTHDTEHDPDTEDPDQNKNQDHKTKHTSASRSCGVRREPWRAGSTGAFKINWSASKGAMTKIGGRSC